MTRTRHRRANRHRAREPTPGSGPDTAIAERGRRSAETKVHWSRAARAGGGRTPESPSAAGS